MIGSNGASLSPLCERWDLERCGLAGLWNALDRSRTTSSSMGTQGVTLYPIEYFGRGILCPLSSLVYVQRPLSVSWEGHKIKELWLVWEWRELAPQCLTSYLQMIAYFFAKPSRSARRWWKFFAFTDVLRVNRLIWKNHLSFWEEGTYYPERWYQRRNRHLLGRRNGNLLRYSRRHQWLKVQTFLIFQR